jgi:hypothetical protein
MFLEALIARSHTYEVPGGYERVRFHHVLRLTAEGRFAAIEACDPPREEIVPAIGSLRTSNVRANTGIDDFTYVLGAADPGHPASWVADRVRAYRTLLATLDHPAARAIERFLDDPDRPILLPDGASEPLAVSHHPTGLVPLTGCAGSTPKSRLLIEIEGHPRWWLAPTVRAVHGISISTSRVSVETTWRVGDEACSLCYQRKPLVRLFPQSQKLHAKIVSFDGMAWNGYGRRQGANAPTCEDCASGIARGLDALLVPESSIRYDDDVYVLAWSDVGTLDLREVLAGAGRPVPDGHTASIEVNQGRIALRRHARMAGTAVDARLAAWRRICAPVLPAGMKPLGTMAAALTTRGERRRGLDRDIDYALRWERIAIMLLAGEGLPARDRFAIRRLAEGLDHDDPLRVRRLAFLAWARACEEGVEAMQPTEAVTPGATGAPDLFAPIPGEIDLTATERAALNCGRALSRADTLQGRRARTQRGLRHTHFDLMRIQPIRGLFLLRRHGILPGGREDRALAIYIQWAFDGLPDRFSLRDQLAFSRGFYAQQALDHPPKQKELL